MIDYIIPIAIANLITEQTIFRNFINRIFKPEDYLYFNKSKKFIYDLLSCWTCLTIWTSLIYLILKQDTTLLQYLYIPLINMLVVDIIQKIKR